MRKILRPAGAIHVGHFGKVYDQVGQRKSIKMDKVHRAMKAGKRKTANPHKHQGRVIRKTTYYSENRRNRSDNKNRL